VVEDGGGYDEGGIGEERDEGAAEADEHEEEDEDEPGGMHFFGGGGPAYFAPLCELCTLGAADSWECAAGPPGRGDMG